MAYYRVTLKTERLYEIVVKAKNRAEAEDIALNSTDLDLVEYSPLWVYDMVEMEPKPDTYHKL